MKKSNVVSTPYRKTIYFSIVLSLLFLTLFVFQSCQEVTAPIRGEENLQVKRLKKFSNTDFELVKKIAKSMAIFLKSEQNKEILENAIRNSKKKQQILEASTFLNQSRSINSKTTTLLDELVLLVSENDKVDFKNSIKNLQFGLIDIYFPQKKWRKNWESSDELIVAAMGLKKESDLSDILAYDLDGSEIYLSADKEPELPVLLIYPSEKNGNYKVTAGNQIFLNGLKKSSSIASTNSENDDPPPPTIYKLKIFEFNPADAGHDPWWTPDLEIYFKTSEWVVDHYTAYGKEGGVYECDCDEYNTINLEIISTTNSGYRVKIQAWDEDDGSADDCVSDGDNWEQYWNYNWYDQEYFNDIIMYGVDYIGYRDKAGNDTDYIRLKHTQQ